MFSYDTQGGRSYLVYSLEEADKLSNVTLNMMKSNSFLYLADISFYQIDEQSYARYDITSKIPAKELFVHHISKKTLLTYMQSIVKAVQEADDHMLDARCLCLEMERIYVNVDNGKALIICLPLDREGFPQLDFQRYFKELLHSCTFSADEDSSYIIKLNNYLNGSVFSLEVFEKLLEDLQNEKPAVAPSDRKGGHASSGDRSKSQAPKPKTTSSPVGVQPVSTAKSASATPKVAVHASSEELPAKQQDSNEPKMSLFYLLQNYSKENAATYKLQRQKKKKTGVSSSEEKAKMKPGKQASMSGFAIPGQESINLQQPAKSESPGLKQNSVNLGPQERKRPIQPTGGHSPRPEGRPLYNSGVLGTVFLEGTDNEGTIILNESVGENREPKGVLIQVQTRMQVVIDKDEFRLGRNPNYADYTVSGGGAVSSAHAKIIRRDGIYYVIDTNSSNHTFVNGEMIPSMVEKALKPGDIIRLANVEFEFVML